METEALQAKERRLGPDILYIKGFKERINFMVSKNINTWDSFKNKRLFKESLCFTKNIKVKELINKWMNAIQPRTCLQLIFFNLKYKRRKRIGKWQIERSVFPSRSSFNRTQLKGNKIDVVFFNSIQFISMEQTFLSDSV